MLELTKNKLEALKRLSAENGIIGALAIDQRGSLKNDASGGASHVEMRALSVSKNWFLRN